MSYKALIKMREDSKIDISDKDLKKQYEKQFLSAL